MKAYELLSTPEKWCKGFSALDADGLSTSGTDPRAVRWCVMGAITRCYYHVDNPIEVCNQTDKVVAVIGIREVSTWNDRPERTHAEVVEALRKADV